MKTWEMVHFSCTEIIFNRWQWGNKSIRTQQPTSQRGTFARVTWPQPQMFPPAPELLHGAVPSEEPEWEKSQHTLFLPLLTPCRRCGEKHSPSARFFNGNIPLKTICFSLWSSRRWWHEKKKKKRHDLKTVFNHPFSEIFYWSPKIMS